MMDWKTYELAQELYAQYGNICEVHRKLKEQGISKAQCTLYNWYHKNKEDWDQLREKYREKRKENFSENLLENLFDDVVEIKELLTKRVIEQLKDGESKLNINIVYGVQKQIDQLSRMIKEQKEDQKKGQRFAKKLIEVLLRHKVIGPLLRRFIDEILDEVK